MPPAEIDPKRIDSLCLLARLQPTQDLRARLQAGLQGIVQAFADLGAVDTGECGQAPPAETSALRPDAPGAVLTPDQALAGAARTVAGMFSVPRTVEN